MVDAVATGAARSAFWKGLGLGILCALIWGVQAVVSRRSVLDGLSAADVTILRFMVASLVLLPVALGMRPILVGEPGWRRALVLTALAGTPARAGAWRGDLLFVLSSVMWAYFGLLAGRWKVKPIAATASIAILSLLGTPLWAMLVPMRLFHASMPAIALQAIYQGLLVGVLATFLYMRVVMLLGSVRAALFLPLVPIVTALTGAILLDENPSMLELAGMLLVVAGMALALASRR